MLQIAVVSFPKINVLHYPVDTSITLNVFHISDASFLKVNALHFSAFCFPIINFNITAELKLQLFPW